MGVPFIDQVVQLVAEEATFEHLLSPWLVFGAMMMKSEKGLRSLGVPEEGTPVEAWEDLS